ncbi:type II toxin-antitoxin system RelE/ParE family toxin [Methylocapsa sp. S129]|uniref:type II toxin-antitoxin system RelE/ParE family toxin n=1 Tax=Methylocapsa sp. S129 TaxID=1641869 RepID=UPI00131E1E7E|nr:type II toxin-antitoxin system RelE/ParE family toxin [Methylocapsa sp. S129]
MHAVCETKAFERAASGAGMSRAEVDAFIGFLAANPDAGDEIQGSGGCRKIRVAGEGRGKSGGYRVVTFFTGEDLPIFLLTVFAKGEKANLSAAERNGLAKLTAILAADYGKKIMRGDRTSEG